MSLRIDFVTLFPEQVQQTLQHSITGRAIETGLVETCARSPREFATDAHGTVDDRPFGGGPGMVLRCAELHATLTALAPDPGTPIVFFEPSGRKFTQSDARRWASGERLVLVCGHYEGIDQRMIDRWATDVISLGDFILTGGELPAMVVADATIRNLPGVLGSADSLDEDSHADGLLSYPQYTRPAEFEGMTVPEVLLSGDHGAIARWRRQKQIQTTRTQRPDLFSSAPLSRDDLNLL